VAGSEKFMAPYAKAHYIVIHNYIFMSEEAVRWEQREIEWYFIN
jgi:hypothetical protein